MRWSMKGASTYMAFDPSERTLRTHVPKTSIQGKCDDATKERYSAKRMKHEVSPIEDFYKGSVEYTDVKIDLPTEDFYGEQDSMKKIVEKKGKNKQKHHKQLSAP
jgi:hypothetical protein